MAEKKLKILLISFDWRNIFETDFNQLKSKLNRDRLLPDYNDFFIFAWSNKTYYQKKENFETVHVSARFQHIRLIYDFLTIFILPFVLLKKRFRPDIIICYDFPFVLSAIVPKYLFGSRIVFILAALPSQLVKTRGMLISARAIYQLFAENIARYFIDIFFAIGEATKSYLLKLGIKNDIMIMVPDVFSECSIDINKAKIGVIKEKYNISNDKRIILSVGRLEPEKNYELLLNTWSEIVNDDVVLVIVGEGSLKNNLDELVEKLGIKNSVIFAGHVSRQEIWNYYKESSAFMLFSKSEGLGLVFWEAMYMMVPVIGSRVGGIVDTIGENEERGYFWQDDHQVNDLRNIIDGCMNKSPEVAEKIKKAFMYVEEKIQTKNTINSLLNK